MMVRTSWIALGLIGCGAASPARPAQLGAGYFHNTIKTGGCSGSSCEENAIAITGGQGVQLEALIPREHVTPRVSLAVARERVDKPFTPGSERARYVGGKLDWLFGAPSTAAFSFHAGLGLGLDALSGETFRNAGLDLHGIVEAEYRWSAWSATAGVMPEVMFLAGDGLSADGTGLVGLPAYVGIRRDLP